MTYATRTALLPSKRFAHRDIQVIELNTIVDISEVKENSQVDPLLISGTQRRTDDGMKNQSRKYPLEMFTSAVTSDEM
jgi:hypothetical protein